MSAPVWYALCEHVYTCTYMFCVCVCHMCVPTCTVQCVCVVELKIIVATPDEYSLISAELVRTKPTDLVVMRGERGSQWSHSPLILFNHRLIIFWQCIKFLHCTSIICMLCTHAVINFCVSIFTCRCLVLFAVILCVCVCVCVCVGMQLKSPPTCPCTSFTAWTYRQSNDGNSTQCTSKE